MSCRSVMEREEEEERGGDMGGKEKEKHGGLV